MIPWSTSQRSGPSGARGMVRPGRNALQVVIGPQAEILAGEIREAMASGEYAALGPAVYAGRALREKGLGIGPDRPAEASAEDTEIAQRWWALSADLPMSKRPSMSR